jgi:hypothetical protein
MKTCPSCNTIMEEVKKPVQPAEVALRARSECPSCHHMEEGYPGEGHITWDKSDKAMPVRAS